MTNYSTQYGRRKSSVSVLRVNITATGHKIVNRRETCYRSVFLYISSLLSRKSSGLVCKTTALRFTCYERDFLLRRTFCLFSKHF
jgi:hypothetical protein